MTPHTKDVQGITMKWWESGVGPAVVYIHGIPTSPALWRHVIPRTPNTRNLAWEKVGYGDSIEEGRSRDISVARQAHYLKMWMDAIDLEEAYLVGHDLGGGVAQILAVRHPDRVKGLVLMNAVSYDSWPIPSVVALRAISPVFARLPNVALYLVFLVLMFRGHRTLEQAREALGVHWPRYGRADGTAALARQVNALDVQDTLEISDQLSELNIPARLVWGAADPFQPIEYGRRLARELEAPLHRIEGGKHYVPEDYPDHVAAAIRDIAGVE